MFSQGLVFSISAAGMVYLFINHFFRKGPLMKSFNSCAQIIWVAVVCLSATVSFAGTAFTYQGRLLENNAAADGLYDMQFKLYDDPNVLVGSQIGSTVMQDDVDVTDGYFIAQLDFGSDPNAFNGDARWLQIAVRPYDSANPDDFIAQSPLQEITPAPYAVYAEASGSSAPDLDWTIDGINTYSAVSGNVGIGTSTPAHKLDVVGDVRATGTLSEGALAGGDVGAFGYGQYMGVYGVGDLYGVFGGTSSSNAWAGYFEGDVSIQGDVGIGTQYPAHKLDVVGDVRATGILSEGALAGGDVGAFGYGQYMGVYGVGDMYGVFGGTSSPTAWAGYFEGKVGIQGDVGIGTNYPEHKLDVLGTVKATAFVGDGSGLTNLPSSNLWHQSASNIYYNSGNVGIGTTSPSSPLDIKTSSAGYISVERGSGQLGGILWKETGASDTQWIFPFFRGWQSDNLIVREEVSNLDVMTFQFGTGNVGIGTNSPTAKLEIAGQVKITGGSPGAGKVLTSDAAGLANWQTYEVSPPLVLSDSLGYPDAVISGSCSASGMGVHGSSSTGVGVYGENNTGHYGWLGSDTYGVYGNSGYGNWGYLGGTYGVYGKNDTNNNWGYIGGSDYSVYGSNVDGFAGYFVGNVYVTGEISAQTVTDRTPYPKDLETAYDAVMSMERLPDGLYDESSKENQLDHSKLNSFIQSGDGNRDLSATVSCLNEVVKDLVRKIDAQQQTIELQQQQIQKMAEMLQLNSPQNTLATGAVK